MKRLLTLLSALILSTTLVNAQTIDTTSIKPFAVVKLVNPFAPKWGDTTKVHYLTVQGINDNYKDAVSFRYVLFGALNGREYDGVNTSAVPILDGTIECNGEDYAAWNGSNIFPFQFVSSKLGVEVK